MTKGPEPVQPGEYGVVVATSGPLAGKVGLYDDDESCGMAIVYFDGAPFLTPYVLIKRALLRPATPAEAEAWQRTSANDLATAEIAGTPSIERSQSNETTLTEGEDSGAPARRPTLH